MICVKEAKKKEEEKDVDSQEERKKEEEDRQRAVAVWQMGGGVMAPTVKWKGRPETGKCQRCCGILGLFLIGLQLLILLSFHYQVNGHPIYRSHFGSHHHELEEPKCRDGYINVENEYCVTPALYEEYRSCAAREKERYDDGAKHIEDCDGRRRLDAVEQEVAPLLLPSPLLPSPHSRRLTHPRSQNVWEVLGDHAYIPATIVPLMILAGVLWIMLLQRWAKPVIWSIIGSFLLGSLVCAFLPLFFRTYECEYEGIYDEYGNKRYSHRVNVNDEWDRNWCESEGGHIVGRGGPFLWPFLIPLLLIATLSIYNKRKINVASICLSKCAHVLLHQPMIIASSLVVYAAFVGYVAMWIGGIMQVGHILRVDCTGHHGGSYFTPGDACPVCLFAVCFLLFPSFIYFNMMHVPVSAAGVGGWYFNDDPDVPKHPALVGLKWTFTSSSGPIFLTTLVAWPIVNLRILLHHHLAKYALLPCLPCAWAYYSLCGLAMLCVRTTMSIHRFMLIAHTFHGGDLFVVSRNAWNLLKSHVGGAVVTETVAMLVLNWCVSALAVMFAFATWAWMEYVLGEGTLHEICSCITDPGYWLIFTLLVIFGVYVFHQMSDVFSIVILILQAMYGREVYRENEMGWFVGLFFGAICNLLLSFLSQIIGSGMDTIYYCYALEAEFMKIEQSDRDKASLTNCIKEHIVQPIPESIIKAEATAIEPAKEDHKDEGKNDNNN